MSSFDPEPKYTNNKLSLDFGKQNQNVVCKIRKPGFILLEGVLSPIECKYFRNLSNTTNLPRRVTGKREKITIQIPNLSEIIHNRCCKYIPNAVYKECDSLNNHKQKNKSYSYWVAPEINPNWRLVKCNPHSSINQHLDGTYVKGINKRSIYTIMIYLSSNTDGKTVFKDVEVTPKEGSVLIFNQEKLHHGDINTTKKVFYTFRNNVRTRKSY